ncbi:MAG: glycine dehydrogenase (aminomethyl-transferring), partial [Proteobacteria bacterium]|nr:glycine dehydrogenase (aminomethyl-transferring) [Pseudomonadota bacterium]
MFQRRHIGPSSSEQDKMLKTLNLDSLESLIDEAVPASIRMNQDLELPGSRTEVDVLQELKSIASENTIARSYIGMGYYDTITPNVILRNLLENPGWYTAYTPYQAEVSQGRLEALLNYQQMVMDLTGMDIANASLLDEATAAAEAMAFSRRISRSKSMKFFASEDCHPQTLDVLKTRAEPMGIELVLGTPEENLETEFFGVLLQYPSTTGVIHDIGKWIEQWHQNDTMVSVATDLLSLVLLKPPGELGADVVIGNSQ